MALAARGRLQAGVGATAKRALSQYTIGESVTINGVGLHSGMQARVTLKPAPPDHGIRFSRLDVQPPCSIQGHHSNVQSTKLCTTIGHDAHTIGTVEHLLAALTGVGVDNVLVEATAAEIPILDGSAAPFATALRKSRLRSQVGSARRWRIAKRVEVRGTNGEYAVAEPNPEPGLSLHVRINFDHPTIGSSSFTANLVCAPDQDRSLEFDSLVAPARTFCLASEVELMRSCGLALGGSLENAVVFDDSSQLAGAVLNNEGLRFPDEAARHKALDLLGDLRLLGYPVMGRVRCVRPGHTLSHLLRQALLDTPGALEEVTV